MDDKKKNTETIPAQVHPHVLVREQVIQTFTKEFHRENYVDPQKMQQVKESAYKQDGVPQKTMKDSYSGNTLHKDGKAALNKYGKARSTYHKSQTDHVVPLKEIHNRSKYNAFLTDEDIKRAANQEGNLKEVSQHQNQSKGGMTYKEYVKKHPELSLEARRKMLGDHRRSCVKVYGSLAKATVKNVTKVGLAGAKNALIGAAPTLINETVRDVQKVIRGDMTASEAAKDIGKKAGTVVGVGAGVNIASTQIAHMINQCSKFEVTPAQIGTVFTGVIAIKNAIDKLSDDSLETSEALLQITEDCLGMIVSHLGYVIGSAGGVVCATVCSAVLSYAYNSVIQIDRECRMSKKIRIQSEKYLQYVQERSAQFRREFTDYAKGTLEKYDRVIGETFAAIQKCVEEKNPDILFAGINTAGAAFGVEFQFKTFEEFDAFMSDEDSVLVF